jgi:predicted transcriptional regulator
MISTQLQKELNKTISGVHQIREPVDRARAAVELITHLQQVIRDLSQGRREAIAEAVQWPGESMSTVAAKLEISKSAVAKLAPPVVRNAVADDLRTRLSRGFNPPPLGPRSPRH